jgi:phosphoribosylformylglycinamidine cyclo-ligase
MADPEAGLSYRDAGVDREAAGRAKDRILELIGGTHGAGVISRPGGFGGLFRVPAGRSPVLVSSADGVGTKLKVAILAGIHDTVGEDLVNHCVDDILVEGARPLFFLDYIGMGRLETGVVESVVEGLARACTANGCALLGGETAEMPDFYAAGEYDLAGFVVGVAEEDTMPGAHQVGEGDLLLALASNGFHTNGYSLLRKLLFDRMGLSVHDRFPDLEETVADVLLRPHRSYLAAVHPLIAQRRVHALAHITGGGIPGNLDRVMPAGMTAVVESDSWEWPDEFRVVMDRGGVARDEMFRTFNNGVGMILVVPEADADDTLETLSAAGETAWRIGHVEQGGEPVRIL